MMLGLILSRQVVITHSSRSGRVMPDMLPSSSTPRRPLPPLRFENATNSLARASILQHVALEFDAGVFPVGNDFE